MNQRNRLQKLEENQNQAEQKIFVVEYGEDGRAMDKFSKELAGKTDPEVRALLGKGENTVLIRVVRDSG